MFYRVLADIVVVSHFAFVLFVVLGGLLVLKWRRVVWVHVPAVLWAALVEFTGWICPLTPLENVLREKGGARSYSAGFIEHYIMPVLYPSSLTRQVQIALGVSVLAINFVVYLWILRRAAARRRRKET